MKVKMWGVRGSIPSPGKHTREYGGNTTCIEVRTDDGTLIVLDAGTGIFLLSQALLSSMPLDINLLISHTHWDHIQGLPFFAPIFVPGNRVIVYGPHDSVSKQGIEQAMEIQMQYSFFPIRESEINAQLEYRTVNAADSINIGDAVVTGTLMNHPVINFGYRIECNGKSLFFTGDHEPYVNLYDRGHESYAEYQHYVEKRRAQVDDAMRGVDLLITDCSYTIEEFPSKLGWGHGTIDHSIMTAKRVDAKRLLCTHHEPMRDDESLKRVFGEALSRHPQRPGDPEIVLAYEGLELEV